VWYARSETLLPAKVIHMGSIGRNWGKEWQDRFFSGLSMMDRNGDDNVVGTGEPRETLTEESTSIDTWKKISQISGFCDLDTAVKLLRVVQGGRKSFPVRKLKDLAMHLKARGVEETFQVYSQSGASEMAGELLTMSSSRAVSVPQPRRTNHRRNFIIDRTLHRPPSTAPSRTTLSSFSVTYPTGPSAAMKTQGGYSMPTRCISTKYWRPARVMRDSVFIRATTVFRYLQKG